MERLTGEKIISVECEKGTWKVKCEGGLTLLMESCDPYVGIEIWEEGKKKSWEEDEIEDEKENYWTKVDKVKLTITRMSFKGKVYEYEKVRINGQWIQPESKDLYWEDCFFECRCGSCDRRLKCFPGLKINRLTTKINLKEKFGVKKLKTEVKPKYYNGREYPPCFVPCPPFYDICNATDYESEICHKCYKKYSFVDYIE